MSYISNGKRKLDSGTFSAVLKENGFIIMEGLGCLPLMGGTFVA